MSLQEQYESRRKGLERNIAEAEKLIAELRAQFESSSDQAEKGRLEVNIEDVTSQLQDWHYALSELTEGKE